MQPIVMQDWITIRGAASTTVIQSQADWIFTAPFQDVTFYLDVREFSPSAAVIVSYQTAPAREEAMFQNMFSTAAITTTGLIGPTNVYLANAAIPVSHWTRWKLSAGALTWDLTFRIMMAGNSLA